LVKHGWKPNESIVHEVFVSNNLNKSINQNLLNKSIKPTLSAENLEYNNVKGMNNINNYKNKLFALIPLDINEFWLGEYNFYVITKYNKSINYAMAVYQLSKKIKDAS